LSPHPDDAVLFAAFTALRENPLVLTVFDSHVQAARGGPTMMTRRLEDERAMAILGAPVMFMGLSDADPNPSDIENRLRRFFNQPEMVYAPKPEAGGHPHHNMVGEVAGRVFHNVTYYMTYTKAGKSEGVRVGREPAWVLKKLQALACYESQITRADNVDHFLRTQDEFYAA
jgi:LmbE family N-acetylglucosaminyl deacetylase